MAKLFAIDDFELYLFSYGVLPLNGCYLLARLCIAAELSMGVLIGVGWWRHWVNIATALLLLCFSLFLCYAALIGRRDSCQCLGRLADLDPLQSLLKNALLLLLLLLYSRTRGPQKQRLAVKVRRWFTSAVIAISVVAVFCISVPDNWLYGTSDTRYNRQLFEQSIAPDGDLSALGLFEGHHLVAFLTPGCPYCRMARQKIDYIAQRHHLPAERIHYLEPSDIGTQLFLNITYGARPLILLVADGMPTTTYHYRNISERQVKAFLQEK